MPASWPQVTQAGAYRALNPLEGKLSGVYTAKPGPNAEKQLIPQYFAVLPMEDWDRPEAPVLSSKLHGSQWISLWDPRNRWLYLLVWGKAAPAKDQGRTFVFDLR